MASTRLEEWFERIYNQKDRAAIRELGAEQVIVHLPDGGTEVGIETIERFLDSLMAMLPDMTITVDEVFVDGDREACRWTLRGTHTGSTEGLPASNNQIEMPGISTARYENGKLVEGWNAWDTDAMAKQMSAPTAFML